MVSAELAWKVARGLVWVPPKAQPETRTVVVNGVGDFGRQECGREEVKWGKSKS